MEPYYVARDLCCVLCKDRMALKEIEFEEHMNKVHTISTHLDTLYSVTFTTTMIKVSSVSRVKKLLTTHKRKKICLVFFAIIMFMTSLFVLTNLKNFNYI